MNKMNRLKIKPQNNKVAKAYRRKQNGKIELNKKWLPVVYVALLLVCVLLNITNSSIDPASVIVSGVMFAIVGAIFIFSYKRMARIDQMGEDFHIAISYIKQDYAKQRKFLWDDYKTDSRYGIFNQPNLRNTYIDYVEEMNRLESEAENTYRCDIEDYINHQLIDDCLEKGKLSLVPGAMTGLGILGTFIGLSLGLQAFNTGSAEQITQSIGPLMDGIKVAFHTSIYGMIFSLVYNLILKTVAENAYHSMDAFLLEFRRYVCPDARYDNERMGLEYQRQTIAAIESAQKKTEEALVPYMRAISENIIQLTQLTKEQNDSLRKR